MIFNRSSKYDVYGHAPMNNGVNRLAARPGTEASITSVTSEAIGEQLDTILRNPLFATR
jgi:hypothetical protein